MTADLAQNISIVVPVAPWEGSMGRLVAHLAAFAPSPREIILVGPEARDLTTECAAELASGKLSPEWLDANSAEKKIRWIVSEQGRAKQQNAGAKAATGAFVWFVHADSTFASDAWPKLLRRLNEAPRSLHFFDLQFSGSPLLRINNAGANFRTVFFGMPFGDQAYCLSKVVFDELGGFDETLEYGEDLALVWRCHIDGVHISRVFANVTTSGRRYEKDGWLKTTITHLKRTYQQAVPFYVRYVKQILAGKARVG
jgi:hypothetical protein